MNTSVLGAIKAIGQEKPAATSEEILERARTAMPLLRQYAPVIEEHRKLPTEIVDLLRSIGVFRAAMPVERGGPQMSSIQQCELIEILASGDASTAWCAMIGIDSGIYSGYLAPEIAQTFYPNLDVATAGALLPQGRAELVEGGYNVTGRWRFGSGITHAEVVVSGCRIYANGQPQADPVTGHPLQWRVFVAKAADFELHDTWHTTGLAGTGSVDYSADNIFIPSEHTFDTTQPRRSDPLLVTRDAVQRKMSGIPLGIARAAIDYVKAIVPVRLDRETQTPWLSDYRVHSTFGQVEMELAAARASVYSSLTAQWHELERGNADIKELLVTVALARYNAFRTAQRIIHRLYDLVGGAAVYRETSSLDRWLRDVNTMCQHAVAQDAVLQMAGTVLLGNPSPNPFNPAL